MMGCDVMNRSRPTAGDLVVVVSAIALVVVSFLDWLEGTATAEVLGRPVLRLVETRSGWGFALVAIAAGLAALMAAQVVAATATSRVPDLSPFTWGQAHVVLAMVVTLLVLAQLAIGFDVDIARDVRVPGVRVVLGSSPLTGAWLGLVATGGLLVGAARKAREGRDDPEGLAIP
jgi:hypothetical protein